MANTLDVKKLVKVYEETYRHPDLESFNFVELFDLKKTNPICPQLASKNGVYVILKDENVIYIGQSSSRNKAIWHRINDHIYSNTQRKTWADEATHFIGWAMPDTSPFEASSLEGFLISQLSNELTYNTIGKQT